MKGKEKRRRGKMKNSNDGLKDHRQFGQIDCETDYLRGLVSFLHHRDTGVGVWGARTA